MKLSNDQLLAAAIERAGSQATLARWLGVKPQNVSWWVRNGLPAWCVESITSKVFGGRVPRAKNGSAK